MQENLFLLLKMQRNPLPPLLPSSDKNGRHSEFEEKGIAFDCFASSDNISIMSFLFP